MSEISSISDEILQQAQTYIQELLKSKRLKPTERAQLEIQGYFWMFLVQNHQKMNEIYPYYIRQKERQERWDKWWEKFQWVVIPIAAAGLVGIIGQLLYFWVFVAPEVTALVQK